MPRTFIVEDQTHAESAGGFQTIDEAWAQLRRLSRISWDEPPNVAPCQSWRTCGRDYEIIEYETSRQPWAELGRYAGLRIGANGLAWGPDAPAHDD